MTSTGADHDDPDGPAPTGGEVLYECSEWSGEARRLLAGLLESADIDHAWQGTTVAVRATDEAAVDALVDDVLAGARPSLPPDAPRVVYEVGAWPVVLQTELTDALTTAEVPYEWDAHGDLVVLAEDEERVEELLAELPDPPEDDLDADDGLAVHELLDRLFVASDRLVRRPSDAGSTLAVDEVAPVLASLSPPFGFEPPQWRALVAPATELHGLLAGDEPADDDEVVDAARRLRDLLRTVV